MPGMSEAASELESIARHLRRAGQTELRRSLLSAIGGAVRPVGKDVRAGLREHLPDPYAATLNEDLRITTATRATGENPSARVTVTPVAKARKLRNVEAGALSHPLYGDREHWYRQTSHVVPGFVSGPAEAAAPRVLAAIGRALVDVAEAATRKGP